jgi:hypothetical protein
LFEGEGLATTIFNHGGVFPASSLASGFEVKYSISTLSFFNVKLMFSIAITHTPYKYPVKEFSRV